MELKRSHVSVISAAAGVLLVLLLLTPEADADIYMHNFRGSNNRLNEDKRNRANPNRLFDSQNNNRGGYNVGTNRLEFYANSVVNIQWTNQHSCGDINNHCEMILQYMCSPSLRDGTNTGTINEAIKDNKAFGMHEDFDHYARCETRPRNAGLFVADQKLGDSATSTRQNPGATRYGFECAEERDYYPYWKPSPWKDVAVLTNDPSRCKYYQDESQNVKSRWYCKKTIEDKTLIPDNKEDCEAVAGATWKEEAAHGTPAPECREAERTRDNHLGNGASGFPVSFNWTAPDTEFTENSCAFRIRYNISTGDYDGWQTVTQNSADDEIAARTNKQRSASDAAKLGYQLKNNPQVEVAPNIVLQLAINTQQFGRVFQDRSHAFSIRPPDRDLEDANIVNVNVQGKRGNIVQVYPAVEYDFVPNRLEVASGDYIHFHWTGSDSNPGNNDGQGKQGSDRSNVVLLAQSTYPEYASHPDDVLRNALVGHWGRSYPANRTTVHSLLGFSEDHLRNLAFGTKDSSAEGGELDKADATFDGRPAQVSTATGGLHHYFSYFSYFSTRNNNFSNRSQKGRIVVSVFRKRDQLVGVNGGVVEIKNVVRVEFPANVLAELTAVTVELREFPDGQVSDESAQSLGFPGAGRAHSRLVIVQPQDTFAGNYRVTIHSGQTDAPALYKARGGSYRQIAAITDSENRYNISVNAGGSFVVFEQENGPGPNLVPLYVILGLAVAVAAVVGAVYYTNPYIFQRIKRNFSQKI